MLSEYLSNITTTVTHDAYAGVPLATHSAKARGDILELVAKRVAEEKNGEVACDPPSSTCVNGAKRGRNMTTCDFVIGHRRVEVKSAQLAWDVDKRLWSAMWQGIKRDAYDDLLLVLYTPTGVHLFMHDHTCGVTTKGKSQAACGGNVQMCAPRNNESISVATEAILAKMQHMHYASLAY